MPKRCHLPSRVDPRPGRDLEEPCANSWLLTGRPAPRQGLDVLAAETFDRLGIAWQQGEAQRLYNAGLTTQVPWRTTFDTGRRRISRRLRVGQRLVDYENNSQSQS